MTNHREQRPRVLHCVSHLALGGAERVALAIIESLQGDYDFSVYAVRGVADGEVGQALKQQLRTLRVSLYLGRRIPMRWGGIISGAFGLAGCIRRQRPDIIHLHTEIPEASYAALAWARPSIRKIPLVRTIHNSVIWAFAPSLGRMCDRHMKTAAVAGVSNGAVTAFRELRASSGAGEPPTPPVTIFNGVPPIRNVRVPRAPDNVIRIVYGGRLEAEKGTDLLPEIVAQTRLPVGLRAHLTIYGSGRHESQLRALGRHPPPGWQIELLAPVANFSEQLARFDVALLPSRYEGLALVAIEALLAGVQVVATRAPGLRETLPSDHPWLVEVDNASHFAATLENTISAASRWPEIAAGGRAFALAHFTPAAMADGYRRLYDRALLR